MIDVGLFVLVAAATWVAAAALVYLGGLSVFDGRLSATRRTVYLLLGGVLGIAWLPFIGWVWAMQGAAFAIWAAVMGLISPTAVVLVIKGVAHRRGVAQRRGVDA